MSLLRLQLLKHLQIWVKGAEAYFQEVGEHSLKVGVTDTRPPNLALHVLLIIAPKAFSARVHRAFLAASCDPIAGHRCPT